MAEKILFITGKLAERQLKRILKSMKPDFGFKINQIGVNVAALMSENIIIRNVEHFDPGSHGNLIPEWLDKRVDYVLNLLIEYCKCLRPISKLINRKDFGNGM